LLFISLLQWVIILRKQYWSLIPIDIQYILLMARKLRNFRSDEKMHCLFD
jgi:hypothetical protein